MKNILVTGAGGFLGSHVAEFLKEKGYNVTCFDIKEPLVDIKYIKGDLTKFEDLLKATKNIDAICHLGAIGDVYLCFKKPPLAASVNALGTANVLEAAKRNNVKKVIYASTWEVVGEAHEYPVTEEHPCRPDHPYNITKLCGEQLVLSYNKLYNVPTIVLRLATAYGTRMRDNAVIPLFIQKAMKGETITIMGTGLQSRQFTHAKDIANAFYLALNSDKRGEIYHIVANERISIKDLAEKVTTVVPTKIEYKEARKGDIQSYVVSNEKAKVELGWTPQVKFDEGLKELIEYYKNNK